MVLHRLGQVADDAQVDGQQVVAGHAGLARHAGGDRHHLGPGQGREVAAAAEGGVLAVVGTRGHDVQGLALDRLFLVRQVDEGDIAQPLLRQHQGRRAADDSDFSLHNDLLPCQRPQLGPWAVAGNPIDYTIKSARWTFENPNAVKFGRRSLEYAGKLAGSLACQDLAQGSVYV